MWNIKTLHKLHKLGMDKTNMMNDLDKHQSIKIIMYDSVPLQPYVSLYLVSKVD